MAKSTMVELVEELRKFPETPAIREMIEEALAGEYHDFKNKKYDCGKVAVVTKLRLAGLHGLAKRVIEGEFDEKPDAEDMKMLEGLMGELAGSAARAKQQARTIRLEEMRQANPERMFMSARTVWWSHDPRYLRRGPIPLDCFGSPLFESDRVDQFFDVEKVKAQASYGKYPITAWTMANAANLEPMLRKFNEFFPGKLDDVASFGAFAARIERLVDLNLIDNLDAPTQ